MKTKQILVLFLVGAVCFFAGFFVREKLISKASPVSLDSCGISIPKVDKKEISNSNSTTSDNIVDVEKNNPIEKKKEMVRLSNIRDGQLISSPLIVEGEARGGWFFEGSFPVVLTNWDGLIIANGQAKAEGDWMTDEFVKFKAELQFKKPELYDMGALILKKDNPSGLATNDDSLEILVKFK